MSTIDAKISNGSVISESIKEPIPNDCVIPISITSGFDKYFEQKYVTVTGIDQYYVSDIHYWLHNYGSLYEYTEGCDVIVVVGKNASPKRLGRLQRKYPNAIFIEFNKELAKFVNCSYESAITLSKRSKSKSINIEKEKKNDSTTEDVIIKIIAGIVTVAVTIAVLYFGLGFFILLMIFLPGAAKAFLKGFIK